jgi:urease accessory protein UreF
MRNKRAVFTKGSALVARAIACILVLSLGTLSACSRVNHDFQLAAQSPLTVSSPVPPTNTDTTITQSAEAAPSNLVWTADTASSISLSWTDNATDGTGYRVQTCQGSGCTSFADVAGLPLPAHLSTYVASGLTAGQVYRVQVCAVGPNGNSNWLTSGDLVAFAGVASVTAITTTSAQLNWSAVANAASYLVYDVTSGTPAFLASVTAPATSTTITGLTQSTTYKVRVLSLDGIGVPDKNTTDAQFSTPALGAPSAPTNLVVGAVTGSSIALSWTDTAGNATGYEIQSCSGSGCSSFADLGADPLASNASAFTDTTLAPGTTYRYQVRATNSAGGSAWLGSGDITTLPTVPIAPSNLVWTANTGSSISFAWTDGGSTETGYEIQSCAGSGCSSFAPAGGPYAAGLSASTQGSLAAGAVYRFRVRAVNQTVQSAWLSSGDLVAFAGLASIGSITATSMQLNWSASANAASYSIYDTSGGSPVFVASVAAPSTSYVVGGLSPAQVYKYRVRSFDSSSVSDQNTHDLSATTLAVGPATQLVFTTQPSASAVAGTSFATQPSVKVEDSSGNTVLSPAYTISLSAYTDSGCTSSAGGTLNSTPTASSGGTAGFAGVSETKAQTFYLKATSGSLTGCSSAIVITPAAKSKLVFMTEPAPTAAAGANFGVYPIVSVEDTYGNVVPGASDSVTLAAYSNSACSTTASGLSVAANPVAASGGVADFTGLSESQALTVYLGASASGLAPACSTAVAVSPAAAVKLAFTAQPSASGTAGVALANQPSVSVEDLSGNVVTGASNVVSLSAFTDGACTVPAGGTVGASTNPLAASSGVATFSGVKDTLASTIYLGASASGLASACSTAIVLAPGTASQLAFTTQPVAGAATAAFTTQPVVTVQDAYGNTVLGSSASVQLAAYTNGLCTAGAGGTFGATANPQSAGSGVDAFAGVYYRTAQMIYLGATSSGLTPACSSATTVSAGAANQLAFTTQPSSTATAGSNLAVEPAVTVEDAYGNPVPGASNSIALAAYTSGACSTGASGLSATSLTVAASGGVASFSGVSDSQAQTLYLGASSSGLASACSGAVAVSAASGNKLVFTVEPSASGTAGTALGTQPSVSIEDSSGNVVTTATNTVTLAVYGDSACSTTAGGALGASANPLAASSGVATFSGVKDTLASTIYLGASASGLASACSTAITLAPATASQLAFTTQPVAGAATAAFAAQPVVTVQDAYGNTVTGSSAPILLAPYTNSLCTAAAAGTFGATANPRNAGSGVDVFAGVFYRTAQTIFLGASSSGLTPACSSGTTVSTGAASQLAFTTQPSTASSAGAFFGTYPVVSIEDAYGNVVTSSSSNVTLAVYTNSGCSTSGSGLSVSANPVAASAGVASFSGVAEAQIGTVYLGASSGALTACSNPISVTAGAASKLVFTTEPSAVGTAGTALATQPSVSVEDASGNVVASASNNVTLTAYTDSACAVSAGGTLSATLNPLSAASGVAAFTSLKDTLATTFYLRASAAGLASDCSSAIVLAPGSASILTMPSSGSGNNQNGSTNTALSSPFTALVTDANGNPVSGVTLTWAVTAGGGSLAGTGPYTSVTGSNGQASSPLLTLGNTGGTNTVTATSAGLSGSPLAFTATAAAPLPAHTLSMAPSNNGNAQTGVAGVALPSAFVALVTDINGNPVSGSTVIWAVTSGGGSFGGSTTTTSDSNGLATSPLLTLGTVAGSNTVTATSTGLTNSPLSYTATGVAGPVSASTSTISAVTGVTANNSSTSTVTITLKDVNGNVIAGQSGVTFGVTVGSSYTLVQPSGSTNSSGQITGTIASTKAETKTLDITSPAGLTGVTANVTFVAGPATGLSLAVKSGSPSTILDNGSATTILEALVTDAYANPVSGQSVTVSVPVNAQFPFLLSGGTITTSNPASTGAAGTVDFTLQSSTVAGVYTYTATSGALTPATAQVTFNPCLGSALTNSPFASGAGTSKSPYMICTAAQFNNIGANAQYVADSYILGQSISLSGGTTMIGSSVNPFSGTFNGQGYSLTGVSLTGSANYVGLFSYVTGGTILNLGVSASSVSAAAYSYVGTLIGYASGTVNLSNVSVALSGTVSGSQYVGGVAGQLAVSAASSIDGCTVTGSGTVSASSSYVGGFAGYFTAGVLNATTSAVNVSSSYNNASAYVGGLLGFNSSGTVAGCYTTTGTVSATATNAGDIGGLVGHNTGTIGGQSYSAETVTAPGSSSSAVGGLVGNNVGTLAQVYSTGSVSGANNVGGLIGYQNGGSVAQSFTTSVVTGDGNVGGLLGNLNSGTASDDFATGAVSASGGTNAGGAVGTYGSGTLTRVYSTGAVTGNSTSKGGFVGSGAGTATASFWDTTVSGLGTSATGTGAATAVLQTPATFAAAGWDFYVVWQMPSGGGYPTLQWQTLQTLPALSTFFAGGNGTFASPYQIATVAQLQNLAYAIELYPTAQSAYYALTADINLSGAVSPIIGTATYPFKGTFNGQGHTIANYSITPLTNYVGLFGVISAATLTNFTLGVASVSAASYNYVGGVVGYGSGVLNISNVSVALSGAVTGAEWVGGFAGDLAAATGSLITGCSVTGAGSVTGSNGYTGGFVGYFTNGVMSSTYATVQVTGTYNGTLADVGGLAGYSNGSLISTYATGSVADNAASATGIGGLVGHNLGPISWSYSTSQVSASGASSGATGGLVGYNEQSISESYATGPVTANATVGGLIGYQNTGTVSQSYSTSTVGGATDAGGLIGEMNGGTVSDCYATGAVLANSGSAAGGAIGLGQSGTASRVYSTGAVTGSSTSEGGLLGSNSATVSASFWDTTHSGNASSAAGTGESTTLMQSSETFTSAGWDFGFVWQLSSGNYPQLQWQALQTQPGLATLFAGGNGTASSPFQIATAQQLQNMAYAIELYPAAQSSAYELTANINLSGTISPVIGTSTSPFSGSFNGQGYTISNYSVIAQTSYVGLFGYASGAAITNFTLSVGSVSAAAFNYVGTAIGYASGSMTITNVAVTLSGALTGSEYVGGFAGDLSLSTSGIVTGCSVSGSGSVTGSNLYVGGFAGANTSGAVSLSYASIPVTSSYNNSNADVGGFTGYNSSTVSNCYATGAVLDAASSAGNIGGFAGENYSATINFSYSTSTVSGSGANSNSVGGLVGYNYAGTVNNSYSTGNVSGNTDVGGLVGNNYAGTVDGSYSSSQTTGANAVGGLVGYVGGGGNENDSYASGKVTASGGSYGGGAIGNNTSGTVNRVYSSGQVTGTSTGLGGLVGNNPSTVAASFWDTTTSGQASSAGGQGHATAQLQITAPYVAAGWDFYSEWEVPSGGGYPVLQWQQIQAQSTLASLFAGGSGIPGAPYQISTPAQLENMAYAMEAYPAAQTAFYVLTASIDLTSAVSPVIGSSNYPFRGSFNGQGYAITNYSITGLGNNIGLFGYVNGATIENFSLSVGTVSSAGYSDVGAVVGYATGTTNISGVSVTIGVAVSGGGYVGGFAGYLNVNSNSVVTGCSVSGAGSVSGTQQYVGGFAGAISGSLIDSYSTVGVSSSYNGTASVGGLAGYSNGFIIGCYSSTGTVSDSTSGAGYIGGLVGQTSSATIQQSYSSCPVSATGSTSIQVGGLIGYDYATTLTQSYSTGNVTGNTNVGGLAGYMYAGTLSQSYSSSGVTGATDAGGLVGYLYAGTINDSYATGSVSSSLGTDAGGAVGLVSSATLNRVYSKGAVSGSSTNLGGLVGAIPSSTVNTSFWDTATSGQASSAGGAGETTTVMQAFTVFSAAGWDFSAVWQIPSGGGYPTLQWQQTPNQPAVSALFAGGTGTVGSPFQISTATQLQNLAYALELYPSLQSSYFQLTANINLSGVASPVIGTASYPFSGSFNGNNYSITGYSVTGYANYVGLFGYVSGATIQNLSLSVSSVSAAAFSYVGSVIGYASGQLTLSNVSVNLSGAVTGSQYVGGFAGELNTGTSSVISGCSVSGSGSVTGSNQYVGGFAGAFTGGTMSGVSESVATTSTYNNSSSNVGGLLGYNSGSLVGCSSSGTVTNSGNSAGNVGGLVGYSYSPGTITQCYSTSTVSASTASSGTGFGGLVGYSSSTTTTQSYATGSVTGSSEVGGLFGYGSGVTISQSYSGSPVTGATYVGGLVGYTSSSTITDSYATGTVAGSSSDAGGAIGDLASGTATRIFSKGAVSGAASNKGGLVGANGGTVSASYWDTTTSGQASSAGGTGETTANMQTQATYSTWDFTNLWSPPSGGVYPSLQWNGQFTSTVSSLFAGGAGTASNPYQISNATQLGNLVTALQDSTAAQSAFYELTSSINLGGTSLIIGTSTYPFKGTFNGQNHSITGLAVTASANNAGLFGYVSGATIENLNLTVSSVTATSYNNVGGLIGFATGVLNLANVAVTLSGTVAGTQYVGGLAGYLNIAAGSFITGCAVLGTGAVSASNAYVGGFAGSLSNGTLSTSSSVVGVSSTYNSNNVYLGGLLGANGGTVVASYSSTGAVSDTTVTAGQLGGLVGNNSGTITQSYSSSPVSANGASSIYIGGLVGAQNGTITQAYSSGTISGNQHVGGLVGYTSGGGISESYSSSPVTGAINAGGLVGYVNGGTLNDSYATGTVTSNGGSNAAGGIGQLASGTVTRIYSTGSVTGTSTSLGGLLGLAAGGALSAAFWDTTASGISTSSGGSGYATSTLQSLATFTAQNWDFNLTWQLPVSGYPLLQWQQPPTGPGGLFQGGAGIPSSPYQISSAAQLQNLAYAMQALAGAQTAYYVLTANINLSGLISPVIGSSSYPFKGNFNGNGYTISNYSTTAQGTYAGLFGYVSGATIQNLTLDVGLVSSAYSYVGGLIGYANGLVDISNVSVTLATGVTGPGFVGGLAGQLNVTAGSVVTGCSVTGAGSVSGSAQYVGGFAGALNTGTLLYSYSTVAVSSNFNSASAAVGGLLGYNSGTVSDSYSTGAVTDSTVNAGNVGGLVGTNPGTINLQSYSTSTVSAAGTNSTDVGGLVGYNSGTINQAYSTGSVSGNTYVGGLVGYSSSTITQSYSSSPVTGANDVGGLVGGVAGTTTDSYATGAVTANAGSMAGGGIGYLSSGNVTHLYSSGAVTGTSTSKGGLVGVNGSTLYAGFWDTTTSGLGTSAAGVGEATAFMQTLATYTAAGWDFGGVWQMAGGGGAYPILQWQQPQSQLSVASLFAGGSGTASAPYQISTVLQLQNMAYALEQDPSAQSSYYELTANINLSGAMSPVIGNASYPFRGNFNGQGYAITNYNLTGQATYAGLFGYVAGATLSNFSLSASAVSDAGFNYVGTVVGYGSGVLNISGVSVTLSGAVTGAQFVGGFAGQLNGSVGSNISGCGVSGSGSVTSSNSYVGGFAGAINNANANALSATVSVSSTYNSSQVFEGGLLGYNSGTLSGSYSTGTVSNSTSTAGYIGGLVGYNPGTIQLQCYSASTVTASGATSSAIGGLVGYNNGPISQSYSTGSVSGNSNVGGLVGYHNNYTISQSYSSSPVTGASNVGGLAGYCDSGLTDSYATGAIVANGGSDAGGACGQLPSGYTLTRSYSTGTVTGTSTNKGGLVGSSAGTVNASFWDTTVSGLATSAAGLGETTSVMQTLALYTGAAWDFELVWQMNSGYPFLLWQNTRSAISGLFAGGSGTAASPYQISTVQQLQNMAYAVETDAAAQSAYYVLTNTINLSGAISPVIGNSSYPFKGNFNGQGYQIQNYALVATVSNSGLFGYISGATLSNFTLTVSSLSASAFNAVGAVIGYASGVVNVSSVNVVLNGALSGSGYVGGFVGQLQTAQGTAISNCSVTGSGSVSGSSQYVGGFVGYIDFAQLTGASATVAVSSSSNSTQAAVGGLAGENYNGTVVASYSTGAVSDSASSAGYVGGLVGWNDSYIVQSYSTSTVSATGSSSQGVGGLVGYNQYSISQSYSTGAVTGTTYVGGLVGYNASAISQSYSTSPVTGAVSGSSDLGGLVGYATSSNVITDCYATGAVAANGGSNSSGAIGNLASGTVSRIYSTGATTGTNTNKGGLIGAYAGTLNASFWDTTSSGNATSAAGTGGTTAVLQTLATFTSAGWDFELVWEQPSGGGYPILAWQQPRPAIASLFAGGSGTETSPYQVASAQQLQNIAYAVQVDPAAQSAFYELTANIDLGSSVAPVIGSATYPFSGTFNGQGYEILNYALTAQGGYAGLFGYVTGATLENFSLTVSSVSAFGFSDVGSVIGYASGILNLSSVNVYLSGALSGAGYVGGFAGDLSTSTGTLITGCTVSGTGSVSGSSAYVGGFAGHFVSGTISGSWSTLPVTSTYNNANAYVGGLFGYTAGSIGSSYSTGTVTNTAASAGMIGGLLGESAPGSIVFQSYSTSTVLASGSTSSYIGGLIGYGSSATIAQSYSTGSVTGTQYVGGLIGYATSTTTSLSYSSSPTSGGTDVGGLVGFHTSSTTTDCYATGAVSANGGSNAGGGIGYVSSGTATRIYSTGAVTGTSSAKGGLIGTNSGTVSGSFWDTTASGNATSAAGTGETTSNMQAASTFTGASWSVDGSVVSLGTLDTEPTYNWKFPAASGVYPALGWQ